MKRSLLAVALVSGFALSSVVGCGGGNSSSPFGADPDFNAIQNHMANPDGTFDSSNASSVFSEYSTQSTGATSADVAGAASAGTSATSSIRLGSQLKLDDITPTTSGCSDVDQGALTGSCACPGGGSFAYDYSDLAAAEESSSASIDVTLRVAMSACVTDTGTVSGREFVHMHLDRTVASTSSAPTDASVLLVLDVTETETNGTVLNLDVNELLTESAQGESVQISVQVNDGWVVVQANEDNSDDSASFSIRDKNGTWTCSEDDGAGSCTGPNGNVTFQAATTASGG